MNSTDLIEKILREYRQMVPVKTLFTNPKTLQDGTPWTCLDCQEQIFKKVNNDISSILIECLQIVEDPHCNSFPPLKTYTTRFLRSYIDEVELAGEVSSKLISSNKLINAATGSK